MLAMMPPVGAMPTVTGTDVQVNARAPSAIKPAGTVAAAVAPPPMAVTISPPMHLFCGRTGRCRRLEHIKAGGRRVRRTCQKTGKAHRDGGAGDRYSSHTVRSILLCFAGAIRFGNG
jgi:hypothetical protein